MTESKASASWHRLSNVDREARTGDCSVCGPGAQVRIRTGARAGYTECAVKRREYHRDRVRAHGRDLRFRAKYGITEADYLRMREEQNQCCAVCDMPYDLLVVDHCHETGKVRGLLCRSCNLSLGYLRDDLYSAVSAAKYLMKLSRASPG